MGRLEASCCHALCATGLMRSEQGPEDCKIRSFHRIGLELLSRLPAIHHVCTLQNTLSDCLLSGKTLNYEEIGFMQSEAFSYGNLNM